jgi:CDP-diacylglycerol--glycerol-3-phosphate 3-phosphatidyltransferase
MNDAAEDNEMQEKSVPQFTTLADYVRYQTRDFTAWLGKFGLSLNLHPDVITVFGLAAVVVGAVFAARGQFVAAGIALLLGMPLDALDGAIARAMNRKSRFGAFLDSTLDRYADGAIFFGIAYYYATRGEMQWFTIAIVAMIGAYAVSYARARAEGLDIGSIKDGLFDRLVRSVIIVAMLLTGWVAAGLVLLAIGNHLTALQRIYLVWVATKDDETTR